MRIGLGILFVGWCGLLWGSEGTRPYELEWAGRVEDDVPPLVDFEREGEWRLETVASEVTFEITNEQKIWGEKVGKLTYRYVPDEKRSYPKVTMRLVEPRPVNDSFDAVSCWIYGNNWAWTSDPTTPRVSVDALFGLSDGREIVVHLDVVNWKEWFLVYRHLTDEQQELLHQPGTVFVGFRISGGRNTEPRTLYWDNFAIRKEEWKPLVFQPRARRGVDFPYQNPGLNTGEGRLPFPTRPETIAPENLTKNFTNSLQKEADSRTFVWKYVGEDGTLEYRFSPKTGTWSDVQARWNDAPWFSPCAGGGVTHLALPGGDSQEVTRREWIDVTEKEGTVESRWKMWAGKEEEISATVTYRMGMRGKSLVLETISTDTTVANVRHGDVAPFQTAKLVPIPYYTYGYNGAKNRPFAVCLKDSRNATLFLMSHVDWYASNGSDVYSEPILNEVEKMARGNGGVFYHAKTDGVRNSCYERFFLSISPRLEEILPTIPNPKSPWMAEMGKRQWRAHGAGNRENDKRHWANVRRHGITEVVVNDHEVGWRDGGESFTFRTKAAPGKGGDEGMRDYSRYMQDTLGFLYGPYNNFTDFAPVNEFWSTDMISRTRENQLAGAWARCYAPKPSRSVEYCEKLTPINQEKFQFSTGYCDVHTAVAPWTRVDYDPRVPGAGTFAATYYAFGEIMLLQKKGWNGPVYSEGPMHHLYTGLTDGNYAQDQGYGLPFQPWLVDFDLLKMHDLGCNFGMGNPGMFYPSGWMSGLSAEEKEAAADRFFAATLAFGHPGFLTLDFGMRTAMRGYFLLQPLHERYTVASVDTIRYLNQEGKPLDTSTAIATDDYKQSQLVVKYQDGTVICVNGSVDLPYV
ncbi:MAG: hypothetical protein Q4D62_15820, partial [Planctomycetia bacterium]|nr:hypothetical protein [Planctomycetia bacterium]